MLVAKVRCKTEVVYYKYSSIFSLDSDMMLRSDL